MSESGTPPSVPPPGPEYLTLREAMARLRRSPATFYGSAVWRDRLRAVHVGGRWLVPVSAIESLLTPPHPSPPVVPPVLPHALARLGLGPPRAPTHRLPGAGQLRCVIVHAEWGHLAYRRDRWLTKYRVAVRSGSTYVVVGRIYEGPTHAQFADLAARLQALAIEESPEGVRVRPTVVLDVAYTAIIPSRVFESGFALRFPRIRGILADTSPEDVDTLATVQRRAAQSSVSR